MERVAIPIWQGRISPVLDTAARLWICELDAGKLLRTQAIDIGATDIRQRTQLIRRLGIHTLLCGAVSRALYDLLVHTGVAVRPWLTGSADEILLAYRKGGLDGDRFRLPGCGHGRQRRRGMSGRGGQAKRPKHREHL